MMYDMAMEYAPNTWIKTNDPQLRLIHLDCYSNEFKQICNELRLPYNVTIQRVQDVFSYGQFLLRGQLLAANNTTRYYKVRRYFMMPNVGNINDIVKYNLDERRTGHKLRFTRNLGGVSRNHVIFVVNAITSNPNGDVYPKTSHDYYIEYIVYPY